MPSIEKTGKTVDLAIEEALRELALSRDEVQVDILQIESPGLFGMFGRREARVRVTPLKGSRAASAPAPREAPRSRGKEREAERPRREQPREPREQRPSRNEQREARRPQGAPQGKASPPKPAPPRPAPAPRPAPEPRRSEVTDGAAGDIGEPLGAQAAEVLRTISDHLGVQVKIEVEEDARAVNLRVGGEDVGQLIGRRGRTLGSVQYLVSRILNEDRDHKKKVLIDIDGYNESHERTVSEIAERAAERVMQSGRPFSLKPMNPQDRRLVHVQLQDHEEVATESVGEEGSRFVVVYPRSMSEEDLERLLKTAQPGGERRPGPRRPQQRGGRRPPRNGPRGGNR
ncbi:MAG: hypothetical protein GHCLOJNM_03871 [bacterium]|nr:hypothetical protein [bacterium]